LNNMDYLLGKYKMKTLLIVALAFSLSSSFLFSSMVIGLEVGLKIGVISDLVK